MAGYERPWFGELADRGHLITAVHRGKSLLISGAVARLVVLICRAEITRMGTATAAGACCWITWLLPGRPASRTCARNSGSSGRN